MNNQELIAAFEDDSLFWGYHQHSRSYYAANVPLGKDIADDVWFGAFSREGGTVGEMVVQWIKLDKRLVPHLQVFDDAWKVLALASQELMPKLSEVDGQNITPEQFCQILNSLGFEDVTRITPED